MYIYTFNENHEYLVKAVNDELYQEWLECFNGRAEEKRITLIRTQLLNGKFCTLYFDCELGKFFGQKGDKVFECEPRDFEEKLLDREIREAELMDEDIYEFSEKYFPKEM